MRLCTRKSSDPLLRVFLDRYRLNLLTLPREGIEVGDLFLERPSGATLQCRMADIFAAKVPRLASSKLQEMIDISATFSDQLDVGVGLGLLDRLFDAFAVGASAKVRGAYSSAAKIQLRILNPTRQIINVGRLSEYLGEADMKAGQTLLDENSGCFVVSGVVRSNAVQIVAFDKNGRQATIDAAATGFGKGELKLKAERQDSTTLAYKSENPLVIGVELLEAVRDGQHWRLDTVSRALQLRGAPDLPRSDLRFLGDATDGAAFIDCSPTER